MREKINAIKELFGLIFMFFILMCLQTWYILTGNE